jgi:glucose/arabinose dehydrogenase
VRSDVSCKGPRGGGGGRHHHHAEIFGALHHLHVDLAREQVQLLGYGRSRLDLKYPFMQVSVVAGSGSAGHADGHGTQASFHAPTGVAVDGDGNIIVADYGSHRIRKISPDGSVSTLAGSGTAGHADGHGTQASFHTPRGVAVDGDGNTIVADYGSHRIRKISPDGSA